MFSIGFKELIDKCEEYFGKSVTKIGIATIGGAVIIFVIGYAVTASIYPLALWISAMIYGTPEATKAFGAANAIVTIIWAAAVIAAVVNFIQLRRDVMAAGEIRADYEQARDEAVASAKEMGDQVAELKVLMERITFHTEVHKAAADELSKAMIIVEGGVKKVFDAIPPAQKTARQRKPPKNAP